MKRTRLPKKSTLGKKDRLQTAIRDELMGMSRSQLLDFSKASKKALGVDPLLSAYKELADKELARRAGLKKVWGKESPALPPAGAEAVAEALETPFRLARKIGDVYYNIARGKFAEDVVFGADYLVDKLSELHHRGEKAKDRWVGFAKAHGITGKSENDYLKEGFVVKQRLDHKVDPSLLSRVHSDYKKGYKDVIVIPTKVDGKMMYSLMVRSVK
jgi:hypothetical protein